VISPDSMLAVVIVADLAQPLDVLLQGLAPAEQQQAEAHPIQRRRRHYVLGRLAAHRAVARVLGAGARHVSVEVLTELTGAPLVWIDQVAGHVSVSLAHAGRLAVACAWRNLPDVSYSAGVDLEQVRNTEVAQSRYAFSRRERMLLAHAPAGQVLAGLAAWTVKEAAWKALQPNLRAGPEMIPISALSLAQGRAKVAVPKNLLARFTAPLVRTRVGYVVGPDGPYFLALAQVMPRQCRSYRKAHRRFSARLQVVDNHLRSWEANDGCE
jgi:4'-phosphopantetheinyl transferase EntD